MANPTAPEKLIMFNAPQAVKDNLVARLESYVLEEVRDMLACDEIQIQMDMEDMDSREFEDMFVNYVTTYLSIYIKEATNCDI